MEPKSESSDPEEANGKLMFKPKEHKDSVSYIKHNSAESDPGTSPLPSLASNYSIAVSLLEADTFEYDIVNIDAILLNVPPSLSLEQSSL